MRGGSEAAQIYSSNLDDKTLHEVYLWPFAEAVKAGVGSVMYVPLILSVDMTAAPVSLFQ
jgi:beta-glucosidase-like glycosyl hydrolase